MPKSITKRLPFISVDRKSGKIVARGSDPDELQQDVENGADYRVQEALDGPREKVEAYLDRPTEAMLEEVKSIFGWSTSQVIEIAITHYHGWVAGAGGSR